mmetsp:Transcript_29644/g.68816  ORF Transcript_29644/g.68816 Transcript_29644/m.68816 type:complete len:360 (-) Transcript_29644:217-1296(-)
MHHHLTTTHPLVPHSPFHFSQLFLCVATEHVVYCELGRIDFLEALRYLSKYERCRMVFRHTNHAVQQLQCDYASSLGNTDVLGREKVTVAISRREVRMSDRINERQHAAWLWRQKCRKWRWLALLEAPRMLAVVPRRAAICRACGEALVPSTEERLPLRPRPIDITQHSKLLKSPRDASLRLFVRPWELCVHRRESRQADRFRVTLKEHDRRRWLVECVSRAVVTCNAHLPRAIGHVPYVIHHHATTKATHRACWHHVSCLPGPRQNLWLKIRHAVRHSHTDSSCSGVLLEHELVHSLGGLVGHGQAAKTNSLDSRLSPRRPRANVHVLQDRGRYNIIPPRPTNRLHHSAMCHIPAVAV